MKAVIMAGGEGSRLRPLTCDTPKPMARLCGKPVIEHILCLLAKHSFKQAAITLRYLPDIIINNFPAKEYKGIKLDFVEEDCPLGTAGSVKNACNKADDNILVISGDAMCGFDLSAAIDFHRRTEADVTIIAKQVADPREYGLIDARQDGSIAAFIEKPAFSQAVSDLANTGIYILSKSALELIPAVSFFDFAKDLFPAMLAKGMKLMCYEEKGYWCDIGDLDSYVSCQLDMLNGKVTCEIPGKADGNGNIFAGNPPPATCKIIPPVYIGRDTNIDENTVIEASVIDDKCHIGAAEISASIVLPSVYVSDSARLTGAVVCAGTNIKNSAVLLEGCAVGTGSTIGRYSTINPGIKIWSHKAIPPSSCVNDHIKLGAPQKSFFGENGIAGESGAELTPEYTAKIGAAIGSINPEAKIAVGGSLHPGIKMLKDALGAGIQSAGAAIMDFGETFRTRFEFDMNFASAHLGAFVNGGENPTIIIMSRGGLPADRDTERKIEAMLASGQFVRRPLAGTGSKTDMSGMEMLYKSQLIRYAPKGLSSCFAQVRSSCMLVRDTLRDTLYKLGCDVGAGFTLEISSDGSKVTVYDDTLGQIPHHTITALCAIREFELGRDVALPFDAPRILDSIAENHKAKLLRYYDCPADSSDADARKLAAFQMWSRDGLMQAVILLSLIEKHGSLGAVMRRLPEFFVSERTVKTGRSPAWLIREINPHNSPEITEGIIIDSNKGIVLVKPLKHGKGLRLIAEAASSETAEEICADIEKLINTQIKKHDYLDSLEPR